MLLLMMKKTKTYRIIKTSIYTLLCIGFLWWSKTFAENYIDKLNGLIPSINKIIENKDTEKTLFTDLINSFCNSMVSWDPMMYSGVSYNAKNSMFMYRLCTDNVGNPDILRGPGLSEKEESSYINFIKTQDANIDVLKNQLPSTFYKTSSYIETLFDTIAQSYTSIYQASIYGKKGDDKLTKETLIDEFSKQYLSGQTYISICAKDKNYKYPQTCKKMTSYLEDATNTLKSSTNIFNTKLLYEDQKKANCMVEKDNYNTITCGLYGGDITKFVNLMYNELFFYTSFVQYYTYILETQPQFKVDTSKSQIEQKQAKQNEAWLMRQNLSDSRKAVKTSIRLLKELQMTFPMHIGLLMYTEAINTFVQSFNKTLIPIYTLWDIFRNVQDTK